MDYIELGRRFCELRRQQNMTQKQLAEKVGVSTSFIGHIERGSRVASLETFANLCTVLQADANDLLCTGRSSPVPNELTKEQHRQLHALLQYACQLAAKE